MGYWSDKGRVYVNKVLQCGWEHEGDHHIKLKMQGILYFMGADLILIEDTKIQLLMIFQNSLKHYYNIISKQFEHCLIGSQVVAM